MIYSESHGSVYDRVIGKGIRHDHRDTEMNDNKSNQIVSVDETRSDGANRSQDYHAYNNLVKETIDYE